MKRSIRRFFTKKGFTLVELVVVLVMLSIIAAIGVPSYLGYVDRTRAKECELNRKRLASYLDDERAMNESATMQDVVKKYSEPKGGIRCPSCGLPYKASGMTVTCPLEEHKGETVLAWGSSGGVTAPTNGYKTDVYGENEKATGDTLPPEKIPAVTVEIHPSDLTLEKDGTVEVEAEITYENGELVGDIIWSSSDENIATVTKTEERTAKITAVAEGNNCTITCTATVRSSGGETATDSDTINVTVVEALKPAKVEVSLNPNPLTLMVDEEGKELTAAVTQDGQPYTGGYNLNWSVEPVGRVEWSASGDGKTITMKGLKEGTAIVTCTAEPVGGEFAPGSKTEATAAVTVGDLSMSMTLPSNITLEEFQKSEPLTPNVQIWKNGELYSAEYTLDWSISPDGIATYEKSADGKSATITGMAEGEATITCTATLKENKRVRATAQVKVTVEAKPPVNLKVRLEPEKIEMKNGETFDVKAIVDSEGHEYMLDWDSLAPEWVSIEDSDNTSATLKANQSPGRSNSPHQVTITCVATLTDGAEAAEGDGAHASATVNVNYGSANKEAVTVELDRDEIELEVGKSVTLTAKVSPNPNGWSYTLLWGPKDDPAIKIEEQTLNTARVTLLEAKPVNITCTVKPSGIEVDEENSDLTDDASVIVKEGNTTRYPEHLINGDGTVKHYSDLRWWAMRNKDCISGETIYSYYRQAYPYSTSGEWSYEHNEGTTINDGKKKLGFLLWSGTYYYFEIHDTKRSLNPTTGNVYTITHTATVNGTKQTYIIPYRVVYPAQSFDKYLNTNRKIKIKVGDTVSFGVDCTPNYTTNKTSWTSSVAGVVGIEPNSREASGNHLYDTITVTGMKPGKTVITASMPTEVNRSRIKSQKTWKQTWTIEVEDNKLPASRLTGIKVNPVVLSQGESKTITVEATPFNIDWSQLSLTVDGDIGDYFTWKDNKNGTITLTADDNLTGDGGVWPSIQAKDASGNVLKTSQLRVYVTDDPGKVYGVTIQPSNFKMRMGEEKSIAIYPEKGDFVITPIAADPEDVDWKNLKITCNNWAGHLVDIDLNSKKIKAKTTSGSGGFQIDITGESVVNGPVSVQGQIEVVQ